MQSVATSNSGAVFDEDFDVVVVGYGFAGSVTAIEAARAGARVLMIEKTAVPGGISICSYGAVRCASDVDLATQYLTATNGGRTPDDVVRTLAEGMAEQEAFVRDLARVNDAEVASTRDEGKTTANYPFPGVNAFYQTTIRSIPNFSARAVYPWANGAPGGPMLFKVLDDNLAAQRIEIRLSTKAVRLISSGSDREVNGLIVEGPSGVSRIRARRAVVLACGGFEGSSEMQEQYLGRQAGVAGRRPQQHRRRHPDGAGPRRPTLAHVALPRRLRLSPLGPELSLCDSRQATAGLGARRQGRALCRGATRPAQSRRARSRWRGSCSTATASAS